MKKLLIFMAVILTGWTAMAQYPTDKDPYLTQSLSGKNIHDVQAETSGGNISVTGVPESEARIEVFVWPSNSRNKYTKEEVKKKLDEEFDLTLSDNGQKLTAIAKTKKSWKNWNNSLSISFRIYVPSQVATKLRTSGGNIALENVSGNQDFHTSGGNLRLKEVKGNIVGKTSGGNIDVENAGNDIDLTTSGGNITASNCTGKIALSTSGGSLRLTQLDGDINASTSGGSIKGETVKGSLDTHTSGGSIHLDNLACTLDASTSGGNIDVEISQLGKFVKLSNSGGNITIDLPKDKGVDLDLRADRVSTGSLQNFNGRMEEDRVSGSVNGGGIPVTIRGGSRISLNMK